MDSTRAGAHAPSTGRCASQGVYEVQRSIHRNKGMMWALGLAARAASQHEH